MEKRSGSHHHRSKDKWQIEEGAGNSDFPQAAQKCLVGPEETVMERRWYKVWPMWTPKEFEVGKPSCEYIREWARHTPNGIALSFYGLDTTYRELNGMIDRMANGLIGLGLKKGDRVAILMENCPQFVISYFGVMRAGGVVVPLNPMFKYAEIEYEVNDAGAVILVGLDFLYPEVEKVRAKTPLHHVILTSLRDFLPQEPILPVPSEGEGAKRFFAETLDFVTFLKNSAETPVCEVGNMKNELAVLQYTGGTTGIPKGAMITHYSLSYAVLSSASCYRHRTDDIHLGVTPFFHVMGQSQLMCAPLASGGRVVILSRFVPETVARAINHYRVTFWVAATPMVIGLLNLPGIKDYDFSSFRFLGTGGSPISVELQKQLTQLIPTMTIGEGYGLSECWAQGGALTPPHLYKSGFVGIPLISDIRIVDLETGTREVPANNEGEIVIKGPVVMQGYWNKPEETREVLRDGWLHTGDIGLMDEDGYIKILGRKRELIKCSGYSVFPAEVEDLLYRHPAIQEAAVIGVSDPYRGETVKAFITLKPEYAGKVAEEEILEWCKGNMAAYKRPRVIEFREDLPKSAAGKILKRLLM